MMLLNGVVRANRFSINNYARINIIIQTLPRCGRWAPATPHDQRQLYLGLGRKKSLLLKNINAGLTKLL